MSAHRSSFSADRALWLRRAAPSTKATAHAVAAHEISARTALIPKTVGTAASNSNLLPESQRQRREIRETVPGAQAQPRTRQQTQCEDGRHPPEVAGPGKSQRPRCELVHVREDVLDNDDPGEK